MKRYFILAFLAFGSLLTFAQGVTDTQDFFKSNLKIYVVVAVLAIILSLIFLFLFAMEKRLTKLEKKEGMRA